MANSMKLLFLFASTFYNICYCQPNLNKGLVAYFPFNGNLKDESGYNNRANPSNIIFTTDRHGNPASACYFNGFNSFAELPYNKAYNFSGRSNFSISVWVSPDAGNNWPAQAIIVKSPPHYDFTQSVWDYGIYLLNYRGMAGFGYNHILNSKSIINSKSCWYNITITYSAGFWKMYINGREESSSGNQQIRITDDPSSVLVLGKKGASTGDYFKGKMDEIRIYNRILNPEEISLLASNPCSKPDCTNKTSARLTYSINECNVVSFNLQADNRISFTSVKWFFGDGKTSIKKAPVHTYKRGEFNIRAITTSIKGCTDTFSRSVNIQPLKADFSFSEETTPGEILFKARSNGPRYIWDFGDSTILSHVSGARHQYRQSGEYTARLFAENNSGCRDTISYKLKIELPVIVVPDTLITTAVVTSDNPQQASVEKRETEIVQLFEIGEDSVQIAVYDNGVIDGDSVTLIYDGRVILLKQLLQRQPLLIKIPVGSEQETHLLQMYAENLGTIPPNTALMVIRDGENRYDVYISSSVTSNGAVLFRRCR